MGMLYEYSDEELEWMGLERYNYNDDCDPLFDIDVDRVKEDLEEEYGA